MIILLLPSLVIAQITTVKALVGGRLIDGFGGPPLANSVILIEGERIKAIGQVGQSDIPEGAEIISTEGMSVLPGLWDMHVHLMINGHADYAHWDTAYIDQLEMIKERTAQMNKGPLFWTPTVEGLYNYEYLRDNPEKLDNDCWHLDLPAEIIADIEQSIQHPGRLPYFQLTPSRRPTLERKVKQLINAGVVLLTGTDSGIPMKFHCQSTWNELDVWVNEFGIDPMYTIKAATYWPSVIMGVDDEVGTISEGKYADIIAVKGDVLRYISLLQDMDWIWSLSTESSINNSS